jgi:PBSX family phage terminase large subunit
METVGTDDKFLLQAKELGVPKDQLVRFLSFQYVPLPWQLKFHAFARDCDKPDGPTQLGCGGARGPGKSHAVFSQVTLDDCQRFDGLKFLFLRQTGKAASESFEDLIFRCLTGKIGYKYSKGNSLTLGKSRVILGGFETENDIDKYIGIEYDGIAVEELNQLTKNKVDKLLGSMRTSRTDWRPRLYTSFNPGGIGHNYVKTEYVIPYREKQETKTRFIPSTYKDNPYINKEYRDYLEGLGGTLGRAWREGDWDIFEGQYFLEWRNAKHVEVPFKIPESWQKFRSIDPSGRSGITSCHWYALDNDGKVHIYKEYYRTGLDSDQHADEIKRLSGDEEYRYTTIDTAAYSKLGLPETTVEIYERHGVSGLVPSMKNRVMGWDIMHQYLRWSEWEPPKLRVFDTCTNFIRTIPNLIHDELHPEDVDTNGEDHCLTGDTKIDTLFKKKQIKDLVNKKVYVNSLNGFVKSRSIRFVGILPTFELLLENGNIIRATKEHKFLTNNGWKRLEDIDIKRDKLIQSKVCIKSYLILFKNLMEIGIIYVVGFFKGMVKDCIEWFGNTIMGKFLKDFIFTTKIKTGTIMILRILKNCLNIFIYLYMVAKRKILIYLRVINQKHKKWLKFGTNLQKDLNGIVNKERKPGKIGKLFQQIVNIVIKSIKRISQPYQNGVVGIVRLREIGEKGVYDLTVPFVENFTSAGIVIHNSADECRYLLQTLREKKTPQTLSIVEQRLQQLKEQEENLSFNYRKNATIN